MKASLLFVFLALSTSTLLSQSIPVFNTFLFDKYSLNPSYVADNGFSQVNLIHKRLWAGIDDSPVISGLNIQYPYSDKIGFAISFLNDRRILLSNNTALDLDRQLSLFQSKYMITLILSLFAGRGFGC